MILQWNYPLIIYLAYCTRYRNCDLIPLKPRTYLRILKIICRILAESSHFLQENEKNSHFDCMSWRRCFVGISVAVCVSCNDASFCIQYFVYKLQYLHRDLQFCFFTYSKNIHQTNFYSTKHLKSNSRQCRTSVICYYFSSENLSQFSWRKVQTMPYLTFPISS